MSFASDNWSGASPAVLAAVSTAFSGDDAPAYGTDPQTAEAKAAISDVFERDVAVFFLGSGTAANGLAIAHLTRPWGAVFCHSASHVNASECGGPEFFSGAKLIGIEGEAGKITPESLASALGGLRIGDPHSVQPGTLSLTNLTEAGTAYSVGEVTALSDLARSYGMAVHMDGARFANAVARLKCTPAELTWKAGVDALSFGATKNGAIAAEAVVFFDKAKAAEFEFRRMRGGHLLSKHRFVSVQYTAWLKDGHWLALAGHANAMADRLAGGLRARGIQLAWPVEGNEVFPILPHELEARLKAQGYQFHRWSGPSPAVPNASVCRLVASFKTRAGDVDAFLAALDRAAHTIAAE